MDALGPAISYLPWDEYANRRIDYLDRTRRAETNLVGRPNYRQVSYHILLVRVLPRILIIIFRVVSIGSQGHILTSQEPADRTQLPVNDNAWVSHIVQTSVMF
jgi:hypothetical protein